MEGGEKGLRKFVNQKGGAGSIECVTLDQKLNIKVAYSREKSPSAVKNKEEEKKGGG